VCAGHRPCRPSVGPRRSGGPNWLHDNALPGTTLCVTAPAGDFFLDTESSAPVALVSGWVGLTPMVSMAETIAAIQPDRLQHREAVDLAL
jgi:ferredoxin-NADP reductase